MSHWKTEFILPTSISDLFANSQSFYPESLPKNESFKAAWLSSLKFIYWHIWLERNRRVSRDESLNPHFTIIKIKNMWKETLGEHLLDSNLRQQDLDWGALMDLQFYGETRQHKDTKEWQFRGKENKLYDFLNRQARYTL